MKCIVHIRVHSIEMDAIFNEDRSEVAVVVLGGEVQDGLLVGRQHIDVWTR